MKMFSMCALILLEPKEWRVREGKAGLWWLLRCHHLWLWKLKPCCVFFNCSCLTILHTTTKKLWHFNHVLVLLCFAWKNCESSSKSGDFIYLPRHLVLILHSWSHLWQLCVVCMSATHPRNFLLCLWWWNHYFWAMQLGKMDTNWRK